MTSERLPHFSTDLDVLSQVFRRFGEVECKQIRSPLYETFSFGVADDEEMLKLAAARIQGQPPPNVLYAATQYLLLQGAEHPLRSYYPGFTETPLAPADSYDAFRDFCVANKDELRNLISTKTAQTNVVRRSTCLLPAYAVVAEMGGGRPLAQVEVGTSAGLNLLWERYHYDYGSATWGDALSPVRLSTELRGAVGLPELSTSLHTSWSVGVDLHPVSLNDEDAVLWLRALVWPENLELHGQLSAAIEVAREHPPSVVEGDASAQLPALLESAPQDATLCVFASHVLYQFSRDPLIKLYKAMQTYSEVRPVYFVWMEGTGNAHSELKLTIYENGRRRIVDLANCHPHGYWLEWLYRDEA